MKTRLRTALTVLSLATTASLVSIGCNVFGGLNSPGNDAQYVSAARACLDQADFQCAFENYGKLSTADADIQTSETIFTWLAQYGASMKAFAKSFGDSTSQGGKGLTKMSNELLGTGGQGQTTRLGIYDNAFSPAFTKTFTDPQLAAMTKFLASVAIAAEMLAEASSSSGLLQTDLIRTPASCTLINCAGTPAACQAPTSGPGSNVAAGSSTDLAATRPTGTYPTLEQINSAIHYANQNLQLLNPSGQFASSASVFGTISGLTPSTNEGCYRLGLIDQGVGQ